MRTLYRSIRGHETVRAMDVDRARLDIMRAQGETKNMVRSNTGALRGLLVWGYQAYGTYFTGRRRSCFPKAARCRVPPSREQPCQGGRSVPARAETPGS